MICPLVLSALAPFAACAEEWVVDHRDELRVDEALSLRQVVDMAFERYPRSVMTAALQDESRALERRSSSWIAGYPMLYLQYIDDALLGANRGVTEIQSGYQIPLWMWGQKDASEAVSERSRQVAERFTVAVRHEVAGLVRNAVWQVRLAESRLALTRQVHQLAARLTATVRRRVELGDLAQADLLLAESDQLAKNTALVQAEAEFMHARMAYRNLTRTERFPGRPEEDPSPAGSFDDHHPALAAANAEVERAQADLEFTRLSRQGNQPTILVGTDSTEIDANHDLGTGGNIVVQVPVGGDDWHAPVVAESSIILNERIVQRETLRRELEKSLSAARRNLEADRAALGIAERRKALADEQMRMARIAFEAGETNLIDYLKLQAIAQTAISDAAERAILLRRDIAVFNQVVGVVP